MRMTIDDNVDFLNEAKDFFEDVANDPKIKESIKIYLIIESLEMAMSTMRKYQKITDLYDYWQSGKCEYTISCMENIGKVLRGRNDD